MRHSLFSETPSSARGECHNLKFGMKKKLLLLCFSAIVLVSLALVSLKIGIFVEQKNPPKPATVTSESPVLGETTPQIYIYGGSESYYGGLISIAGTDEPSIKISGSNLSGPVEVNLYAANEEAVLDYLVHNQKNEQLNKNPNVDSFSFITKVEQTVPAEGARVLLPLAEQGIYFVRAKNGPTTEDSFLVRTTLGAVVKEGDNEFIFWGQDLRTRRSLDSGLVKLYSLGDTRRQITEVSFGSEGIARAGIDKEADVALILRDNDRAIVPLNLRYLNTGYEGYAYFQAKQRQTKYFVFTDRPLYKPGDTVYFKSVLRDDDDARYSITGGLAAVKVYNGSGDGETVIFQKNFEITGEGTVFGEFNLPKNVNTGYYSVTVSLAGSTQGYSGITVEYYRKPEYFIDVQSPQKELVAGDKSSFFIKGSYFSGQPISKKQVKYRVYSGDFYDYTYYVDRIAELGDDYRYGYWGGSVVTEGTGELNEKGEVEVALDAVIPEKKARNQVYSIEAEFDDGSGNPSFARKNILVYAGEFNIYLKDQIAWWFKVNEPISVPVVLTPHHGKSVSSIALKAKIHWETWVPYQEPDKKYLSYRKEEADLPEISAKTDNEGNAYFNFTPAKTGSYSVTVEGWDNRGNRVSKMFYFWVSGKDEPVYWGDSGNDLTIKADKQSYQPSETARLTISSVTPDRDIFLAFERERLNRFQVVHLNGKTTTVEVPLVETDMPNIYAKVNSFSDKRLDYGDLNIVVSPASKKLTVNLTSDAKKYGPGESVTLNIQTTDFRGSPVSADLAVWSVDKAIFELMSGQPAKIFETFWSERYDNTSTAHSLEGIYISGGGAERGGCFAKGTPVLLADKSSKVIEEVKAGDKVLTFADENSQEQVAAKVVGVHKAVVSGYFILNGSLKVTGNHKLWVNGRWQEVEKIKIGDKLRDSDNKSVEITSIEWLRGRFEVYNLQIEKYKTFFANGLWVHNQKGASRVNFKDTAYWNPSVHTDSSGKAQVTFKLPDNLTTWVISAVGSNPKTIVGQTTSEIVVTKDLIVRPILPNILREGDKITLSALVQNFTEKDQTFTIDLKFAAGEVQKTDYNDVLIKANETQQVWWDVLPKTINEKAKLTFSAKSNENKNLADIVSMEIPILPFGFMETRAETGDGAKTFAVQLAQDADKQKSSATLSLATSILGTLPQAMEYLVGYPWGCVEQTTSRFVPTLIAKENPELFAEILAERDTGKMIEESLRRLADLQHWYGGWSWWSSGPARPYITAYVVEYLLEAKKLGIDVDDKMIVRARNYLESVNEQSSSREDLIAKTYGLTLLGSSKRKTNLEDLNNLATDYLALAVMANFKNGNKDPQSNGLALLTSMAQVQGDAFFWPAGDSENFGSVDASTAFAIRAIVTAGGDREVAVKGARYLLRNRREHYWSNTYATAQVVRAIVDLSKTGEELTPDYTYQVMLDGQSLSGGSVKSAGKMIKDIKIPLSDIKAGGSNISIEKTGEGQIYSTLLINEFRTDRELKASNHGLEVRREYVNDKGDEYLLAVGDTVTVNIWVKGLQKPEKYGVIYDELPSGLTPINFAFKNQQFADDLDKYYYHSYDVTDREYTQNGSVLSLYQISEGERVYSYKARVVSAGEFVVPPVIASLMYSPGVRGRSQVQTVKIARESVFVPRGAVGRQIEKAVGKKVGVVAIAVVIVLVIILVLVLRKKRITNPPPPPPPPPPLPVPDSQPTIDFGSSHPENPPEL